MGIEVIGIMSGTSLDGVDLAHCIFQEEENEWKYKISASQTFPYTPDWKERLERLEQLGAYDFEKLDVEYGLYLGELAQEFKRDFDLSADLISSHGHTAFHNPDEKVSCQIGSAEGIWSITGTPVVNNFRQSDVLLGGQGAPLVPIGDEKLFKNYDFCLNLGGISNISYKDPKDQLRKAFDIAPCNLIFNKLARQKGRSYDENGGLAQNGKIDKELLSTLNNLVFYQLTPPKSLDKKDVYETFLPILKNSELSVEDQLATFTEHLAMQIGDAIKLGASKSLSSDKMLITGGGAYNGFLIERIKDYTQISLILPAEELIEYKEALIFAFIGLLRYKNQINCLQSVTGASKDHVAGNLVGDFDNIERNS